MGELQLRASGPFELRASGRLAAACWRLRLSGVRYVPALSGGCVGPAWGVVVGAFLWGLLVMLLCFAL